MKPTANANHILVWMTSRTPGAPRKHSMAFGRAAMWLKSQRAKGSSCMICMIWGRVPKALIRSSIWFITTARRLGSGGGILDGVSQGAYLCASSWNIELRRLLLLVFDRQGWVVFGLPFENVGMKKSEGRCGGLTVLRLGGSISWMRSS
jgi:hypothetical protein